MNDILFGEHSLSSILEMPDEQAESIFFRWLQHLDRQEKVSYATKGLIAKNVDAFCLWEKRSTSFTAWVREACPWGYSTTFQAMRDVSALKDIPIEDLSEIPQANFDTLKQLSTSVRSDPKVLNAAKTQNNDELVDYIREEHPNQHISRKKKYRFDFDDESDIDKMEDALKEAYIRGARNKNQALAMVAEEALESWRSEDFIKQCREEEDDKPVTIQ